MASLLQLARPAGRYRWGICALLFAVITVNYIDAEITDQLTRSVVDQPSALTGRVQFAF